MLGAQIVWPDGTGGGSSTGGGGASAKQIDTNTWGARDSKGLGKENEVRELLDIPELPIPQAIGINLFRSDSQATNLSNADARARITYGGGRSGLMTFDCDWRGGLVVHGSRVRVEYLSYKLPSAGIYVQPSDVILAATAGINAVHPSTDPTLTYLPELVAADATREIAIPVAARRVSLLMRYSADPLNPGATGDAPLGSTFMSFADPAGVAMAWIDMLNTRSIVFGAGLPIPAGAKSLGLSNDSADPQYLGAVFHLGF